MILSQQLAENLNELMALDPNLASYGFTAESFTDTDDGVATSVQALLSDEELLRECTNDSTNNEEDAEMIEDESEEVEKPSRKAMFEALYLVESYALFQNDGIAKKIRHCSSPIERTGCRDINAKAKCH